MAPREVFDYSADDPPFDPAVWISHILRPETLALRCMRLSPLELPDKERKRLIPGPNVPIAEFLGIWLPKKSSALIFSKTKAWFSTDAPTTSIDCLLSRPILPREFLDDLQKDAGQAWFDGSKSIIFHCIGQLVCISQLCRRAAPPINTGLHALLIRPERCEVPRSNGTISLRRSMYTD
ncbi:hypothetical protein C8J57DRAFT_1256490 [Mycena rebaudengoi]|nr:hypothetical protein C8J57DRAFT_1256490 [Mycena rebaudengoi]